MRVFLALSVILWGLQDTTAVTHSLQYFYTGSSGVPNFPEFVAVGLVDGEPFFYYDSVIRKGIPKQDWIAKNEGPEYWDRQTQIFIGSEQTFKVSIENNKGYFNQTGGAHIFQWMYGCEWDDETQEVNGYMQYGYDGEDYIAFDLKTQTWITPKTQALITKHKWDNNKGWIAQADNYLNQLCPDWVKKYLNYGQSSLMRTVPPSVSFLQKTPSSPVSCHATGFYPHRALMFWTKDGEELHEDVDQGEILPNHDGSFQMSVDLDVSSVKAEDWRRYDCVFQLSGLKDDIVTKLDSGPLVTNRNRPGAGGEFPVGAVVGGVVGLLVLVAVIAGLLVWKKKNEKPEGFTQANTSDTSSSSSSREAGEKA